MQRQHQELVFEGWDQPTTARTIVKNDGKTGETGPAHTAPADPISSHAHTREPHSTPRQPRLPHG